MLEQALAVAIGAALGALLRWRLGEWLNPVFPTLPLGTLAANLLGGFLMGLCLEYFGRNLVAPEVRLALTTGFLGGLTTFSTFSAETMALLLRREFLWSAAAIGAHLIGSLLLCLAGMYCARTVLAAAARLR